MDFLEKIALPAKGTFNIGLTSPKNADMLALFGHPVTNAAYDPNGKCTPVNNPGFKAKLATRSVGPFRVTGFVPALDSLTAVLARVEAEVPDLYALLQTEGMLCARFTKIRRPNGSIKVGPGVSNHSWGTAIDIKLGGVLDTQGDNTVQRGLLVLSTYFNAAGWYWGAAFPVEDAMHFEASKSLLANWRKAGLV
jgi:hypothetical protein